MSKISNLRRIFMLKRILQWVADQAVGVDKALDGQANHVKDIARKFRLSAFPEILADEQE